MNYTESQIIRMCNKIKNLKNGEVFLLNKGDVCPIKVKMVKTSTALKLIDVDVDKEMCYAKGWSANADAVVRKMVEMMLEFIEDWDRCTKTHFAYLARKEGYDN